MKRIIAMFFAVAFAVIGCTALAACGVRGSGSGLNVSYGKKYIRAIYNNYDIRVISNTRCYFIFYKDGKCEQYVNFTNAGYSYNYCCVYKMSRGDEGTVALKMTDEVTFFEGHDYTEKKDGEQVNAIDTSRSPEYFLIALSYDYMQILQPISYSGTTFYLNEDFVAE